MSCPINKDALDKLKQFITICKSNPAILYLPDLSFFKEFIESFGGKLPEAPKMSEDPKVEPKEERKETQEEHPESDPESELEFDMTGCVEPDKLDDNQKMGDPSKEVTEEDSDKADAKRIEAMSQLSEGNIEKAIEIFTEAIELNPNSALLFAKRGQAYLKLTKPNACIRDCTRALELNCDSATAYKFRGRAYRLLGEWELAAKDLRQACNIDLDEQTDEWLKEVTPNAKKIEEHLLKKERKKKNKEEKEKMETARKLKETFARTKADVFAGCKSFGDIPEPDTSEIDPFELFKDPEIVAAFQDPEVSQAFQDVAMNPGNILKYQSNPKFMALVTKLTGKYPGFDSFFAPGSRAAAGAGPGFMGFPGGFSGMGSGSNTTSTPPPTKPEEDDSLD